VTGQRPPESPGPGPGPEPGPGPGLGPGPGPEPGPGPGPGPGPEPGPGPGPAAGGGRAGLAETPDPVGAFPRLTESQLQALAAYGRRQPTRPDQVLYRAGDVNCDFYVVLGGKVATLEGYGSQERVIGVHGPRRFLGSLGLLVGGAVFLTAVVTEPGEVLAVPTSSLRELVARDAALGDLILRAYLLRQSLLIGLGGGLRILGSRFSPDTRRLLEFAARNRLPHRWIDLEEDAEAEILLRELQVRPEETPVVLWRDRQVLRNPRPAELARLLGLPALGVPQRVYDLVVVGAGPAGLAAAVYGASEGLGTLVLDAVATGGQAERSPRIENYLGFPSGLPGAELADRAVIQARKFGAELAVPAEAIGLADSDGYHLVRLADGGSVSARAVLIATGVRYRELNVPRLAEFEGVGVYYAATELEARICAHDPVVVVGGGNSAGQAAVFLAQHAAKVRLLVRGTDLGRDMSRYLVDRVQRTPGVEVLPHTEVRELVGPAGRLTAVQAEDVLTGERHRLDANALFVFIGARPYTGWLDGQLALDRKGFVLTGADAGVEGRSDGRPSPLPLETSRPGVFAVGDARSGSIKRVASAVGEGSMAVRLVHERLSGAAGNTGG
jgi:thioredoxin reductase (NADPH)